MKKIILLAAFMAFGAVSCSDNNDDTQTSTTTVVAEFGNSFLQTRKMTGKDVERGTIPIAIDKITVTATNISTPTVPVSTTVFNLVGNNTGNEKKFYIDNIASGSNSFTASAITNGIKASSSTIYDTETLGLNAFNTNKTAIPYAEYEATTSANIVLNSPQTVAFNMATSQGKLNTYIYTDATITSSNRKVTVQGIAYQENGGTDTVITTSQTYDITGRKSLVFNWSDDLAIAGNYIVYDILIYDASGTVVEKTLQQTIIIKASTTINTTTLITATGLTTSANEATFTFPEWIIENN